MDVFSSQWSEASGWSSPLPALDGPQTLVVVFAGADQARCAPGLADVAAAFPASHVVGCSTAGEINGDALDDDTVTVAVARFARAKISVADIAVTDADGSEAAGRALAAQLTAADPQLRAIFVLSDGLAVNGSALVTGLTAVAGPHVTVTGGLAGDGDRFGATWVLVDGAPQAGHVTAVGLSGAGLEVGHGSQGGWDIFGPERRVTRSEGNVLYELDGRPALELYKTYLGDRADGLPATALLFPLSVRLPGPDGRPLVRTILGVDEEAQSMTFAGDVPAGALAQLMRASFDRLVDGAQSAAEEVGEHDGPGLAVAISCVGRRLVLGRRTEDELEAVRDTLGEDTTIVGFYSYGEISPSSTGTCDLHNQTMTITTIRERLAA